ncbi:UNVERIFIED_ORG: hypothetical protein ABIB13_000801 [Arthrobacter sp. UYEF2]
MGENLLQTTGASGKHPHACRITRTLNEVITTLSGEVVCKLQRTWESAVNQFRLVPALSHSFHFYSHPAELR